MGTRYLYTMLISKINELKTPATATNLEQPHLDFEERESTFFETMFRSSQLKISSCLVDQVNT